MAPRNRPAMYHSLTIGRSTFAPALFCAPMAEITHSAFRRLLADFGGYGALFTEMLSAKALLREDPALSPYVKKRPNEGQLFYQILINGSEPLEAIAERLTAWGAAGLDINCACPAPAIKALRAGAFLFEDRVRLAQTLQTIRRCFSGPLTVKIRLGHNQPGWPEQLRERLQLLEDHGVDALTLHPRFRDEKLKRSARHTWLPWVAAQCRLPLIANGDITGPAYVQARADCFAAAAGLMIGRQAVVQPWIFAQWHQARAVDHAAIWERLCQYTYEDFQPRQALIRMKIFTTYYARNFVWGHSLFKAVQRARDLTALRTAAQEFFSGAASLVPPRAASR